MVEAAEKKQAKQNRLGAKRQHGFCEVLFCSGFNTFKRDFLEDFFLFLTNPATFFSFLCLFKRNAFMCEIYDL